MMAASALSYPRFTFHDHLDCKFVSCMSKKEQTHSFILSIQITIIYMYLYLHTYLVYIHIYHGIFLYTQTILAQWGHLLKQTLQQFLNRCSFQDSVAVSSNPTLGGAMVPGIGWWDPGIEQKKVSGLMMVPTIPWLGGGFKYLFIFTPSSGRFPFSLIFFRWVETTNQMNIFSDLLLFDWFGVFLGGFRNEIFQKSWLSVE